MRVVLCLKCNDIPASSNTIAIYLSNIAYLLSDYITTLKTRESYHAIFGITTNSLLILVFKRKLTFIHIGRSEHLLGILNAKTTETIRNIYKVLGLSREAEVVRSSDIIPILIQTIVTLTSNSGNDNIILHIAKKVI